MEDYSTTIPGEL